ncbi:Acyl-CoA synthetase (NDP forming) [Desulfocicer vacuolatum DSM 3385]|uniref:Acyl-CoA synthetase (NDP forming) n=1 Tax=Desulfocicer vacuolatum DSM 3385 TaxID=1121400 RepID=A0A1W2AHC1_9BACT|nr:acetate--CoA ligase family protein [Desulfocicer vacuolatum]SMC60119.1 Acyl-CoA synthetase (NDP forming) [Desulfocicer vacuolatum DSM 3385]
MNQPNWVEQKINTAMAQKVTILSEKDAGDILNAYDIPMVSNNMAGNAQEAIAIAETMEFPLVLKGCGKEIAHKSELGLVKPGLFSSKAVQQAALDIFEKAPVQLEGVLIQPMIQGKREFVAGMFKDPHFGAVIVFGLGGIFTEALHDVVFRLAPLSHNDIITMVSEISGKKMLGPFRGEVAVDFKKIESTLMGLSRLATHCPEIQEVDINPLIATPTGDLVGVDALVKIGTPVQKINSRPPIDKKQLSKLFFPNSVAYIGASGTIGKWGNLLPSNTISGGYEGHIYMVNPGGGRILGKSVYRQLSDIKESVDLAVVTIPAARVVDLIPQLKEKGIKGMLLITSGFSETGKEGRLLEEKIVQAAARAGIIILGPNTMGICSPHKKFFCTSSHTHPMPGGTALVSQSGNLGVQLLNFADQHGLGMRAYSGSGNEGMVTVEDYMELFEIDEKTQTVVLYLESIKDGHRFFSAAARVSRKKPVIMLKGGRTEAGSRAAASHSGAMASDGVVFDAACRQAGIIQVKKPMEMVDAAVVFSSLPLPAGNRVGIVTLGGGWGVVTSDLCNENGLELADLPDNILEKLNALLPDYWSKSNPIDVVGEFDTNIPLVAMEALLEWEGCDAVIHLGIDGKRIFADKMLASVAQSDPDFDKKEMDSMKKALQEFDRDFNHRVKELVNQYQKPILGVSLMSDATSKMLQGTVEDRYKTVLFPSPERAVRALACMCEYSTRRR